MKKMFLLLALIIVVGLFTSCQKEDAEGPLVVYCYDSFASEWGPGPAIVEAFTAETGIEVSLEAPGDAVTVLTQLIMEKDNPRADVVIGIDNNLLDRALDEEILLPYSSDALNGVPSELLLDNDNHLRPYDWGFFAICYDSETLDNKPMSLEDLTDPQYKDSIILTDPRTSTPGMGFLLWTMEVYGDDFVEYWSRLKPNILTISESWSTAYGLFLEGEAPMVLSYSTSPAYHVEYEESTRYQALIFEDGHPVQIEGAGLVNGSQRQESAKLFLDYLLNEASQQTFALSNIMFPVVEETPLPASFDYALKAEILEISADDLNSYSEEGIEKWLEVMSF